MNRASEKHECLTVGQCATMACVIEATAAKPGNVHRGADFNDMTYFDMLASAVAIGPSMEEAPDQPIGPTVLRAIRATRAAVATNTNLGIVLLLAPLAAASDVSANGVQSVLERTTLDDARDVYAAIRLAKPGGMGERREADVADEPTISLLEAMQLARDHDSIARQYDSGFEDVWKIALWLEEELASHDNEIGAAIVRTHLRVLANLPDSLIMRKCGAETGLQVSDRAADVLSRGTARDESYEQGLADLDFWLRADGNRRNPGTSADLLTAALFVLLRQRRMEGPFSFYAALAL
jgi:triphosphoribosyl-dephospho-CoA synthase